MRNAVAAVADPDAGFETERLHLEALRGTHAAELFPVLSDPRLYRYIPQEPPADPAALAARFERLEQRRSPTRDETWLNWAVRVKADGLCVGRIEATLRPDHTALLAYEIGADHWGRGYATEACRRVVRALFDDFDAERVVAQIDTRNAASIRLAERLGFTRGALKQGADHFKGATSDEYTYTLARGSA